MSYILLIAILAMSPASYDEALAEHVKTGKPLAVFAHAEWCGPCKQMQKEMAKVRNKGLVCYAEIDVDKDTEIADELMEGGSIPQLIVKYRKDGKIVKKVYVGFRNAKQIEAIFDDAHLQSLHQSDQ